MEKLIVNSVDKELESGSLVNGCQHSFMKKKDLVKEAFSFLM